MVNKNKNLYWIAGIIILIIILFPYLKLELFGILTYDEYTAGNSRGMTFGDSYSVGLPTEGGPWTQEQIQNRMLNDYTQNTKTGCSAPYGDESYNFWQIFNLTVSNNIEMVNIHTSSWAGDGSNHNVTTTIYLYNFNTSNWDFITKKNSEGSCLIQDLDIPISSQYINNNKVMIKYEERQTAHLVQCGYSTILNNKVCDGITLPIVNNEIFQLLHFQIKYGAQNEPACTQNWQIGSWTECSAGTQTRTVIDLNNCGNLTNKPATSQSCTIACSPNWTLGSWSICSNGTQTRTVTDLNNCGNLTDKPITSQSCTVTCTPNWVTGSWSTCINGTQNRAVADSNNCNTTSVKPATSQTCSSGGSGGGGGGGSGGAGGGAGESCCGYGFIDETCQKIPECFVCPANPQTLQQCLDTHKPIVEKSFLEKYWVYLIVIGGVIFYLYKKGKLKKWLK